MREAREIIADWICSYNGADRAWNEYLPNADHLLTWLRDEDYEVRLIDGPGTPQWEAECEEFGCHDDGPAE